MGFLVEFLVTLFIIALIPIYFYIAERRRIAKFCKQFPSPPGNFLFGCVRDFTSTETFLTALHRYIRDYGTVVHLPGGLFGDGLICSDPKMLEFFLTNSKILSRSKNLRYLEPWIGQGLITADGGPKWKMHRKLITPAFHFTILEQFVDIFEADGDILIQKLAKLSGSPSVDIYPLVTLYALDVICETAMGTKVDVQNNETSQYFQSGKEMSRLFTVRTIHPFKRFDFLYKFTKDYEIEKKAVKILHDYSNQVIRKKQELLLKNKQSSKESEDRDDIGIKKRKVFLDLIMEACTADGQKLSSEEIREEVDTFMFAGHDTTATGSCYVLYCLAKNKKVQEKVFEEQVQIFGSNLKEAKATFTKLQEMKYLENVIKEALRLYSPLAVYGRNIDEDFEYDGMVIPKGLRVIIFAHGVHMNPKYYPEPEKFDPSRFENPDGRPPFAYIPFGAGSRNCIGQKYAMLEMKSIVSKVIRNFELFPSNPEHNLRLASEAVMKSLNGVKVGLKLR